VIHSGIMDDPRPEAESGAAEPRHANPETHAPRVRCAAVVPAGRTEPIELREAMRRRGVAMTCFSTVYDALLEVLSAAGDESVAVVFVESDTLKNDQASRLARTLGKHIERLTLWTFDTLDGEGPRLRPFETAAPRRERAWAPAPASAPRLRLAGFHDDPEEDEPDEEAFAPVDEADDAPAVATETTVELLTSEEIAMLLDDAPIDGASEREENKA